MISERCGWCGKDADYVHYHDHVWGRPVADSRELFEKLCLDGQQAGLSWITILRKQDNYRRAFAGFDPEALNLFSEADTERLMSDAGIIRNRLKIQSIVRNARAFLAMEQEGLAFNEFIWSFTGGRAVINSFARLDEVPAATEQSRAMSKALKKRGFSFVGETICYAFMQAVGIVNDHLITCPCYEVCRQQQLDFRL